MNAQTDAIVRELVARIIDAETLAGPRVFANRWHPIFQEELPALLVHETDEEVTIRDISPRVYERHSRITLTAFVEAAQVLPGNPPRRVSADPVLRVLGQQLEDVVAFDRTLGGTCADVRILEVHVAPVETSEREVSAGRLVLDVQYFTEAGERGDPRELFDLETVHARWGQKPPEGEPERGPEDDVKLPPVPPS